MPNNPFSSGSVRHRTCDGSRSFSSAVPFRCLGRVHQTRTCPHNHPAARRAHPHHLAQHADRIEEMVHGKPRHHDIERAVRIGQRPDIAAIPGDVADRPSRRQAAARGRASPASCRSRSHASPAVRRRRRRSRRRMRRPAPYRPVVGAAAVDDHAQRVRIGDGVGRAEWRRLAGELVQDPLLVALCRSLLLHPNR